MSDPWVEAGSKVLLLLRKLEVWFLLALAAISLLLIFVPTPLYAFHDWFLVGVIVFSVLAFARAIDRAIVHHIQTRRDRTAKRALRLVTRDHPSWWSMSRQRDDTFVSQISLDVEAANLADHDVRMVRVRLIRPRRHGELLHGDISLPTVEGSLYSDKHPVPAHNTVTGTVHILVRGKLGRNGKPVRVTIEVTDQHGDVYRLDRVLLKSLRPIEPWRPLPKLAALMSRLPGLRPSTKAKEAADRAARSNWEHRGALDDVERVLKEEQRSYAANGRSRGGLGSLNVTLQSEPNFGWTTVGEVPKLLWDRVDAKQIESLNLARVLEMYSLRDAGARQQMETYLLSHLHKGSPFAGVSYFIFIILHRLGKTSEALDAARTHLLGDRDYSYSNLLGTLSAIVSHEHFSMTSSLYDQIEAALPEEAKQEFRLGEKLNLGRLQVLDQQRSAVSGAHLSIRS